MGRKNYLIIHIYIQNGSVMNEEIDSGFFDRKLCYRFAVAMEHKNTIPFYFKIYIDASTGEFVGGEF